MAVAWFGEHKKFDEVTAPVGLFGWLFWLLGPAFAIIGIFTTNLSCNTQSQFADKVPWLTKYYQGDKVGTAHSLDHVHQKDLDWGKTILAPAKNTIK